MPSRNNKPPDIWNTHGISGNVFVNSPGVLSPYPGGFNPWISNVTEDTSPHVTSERQTPDTTLDPRCQSGPSARNSFTISGGDSSKDYAISLFQTTFACWKIRFKTEVCSCSQFPSEAWNPRVLGSSERTPEEPLRRGGAQGGSGSSLPTGSPIVGSRVSQYRAILVNLLHLSRARCRSCRGPIHRVRVR